MDVDLRRHRPRPPHVQPTTAARGGPRSPTAPTVRAPPALRRALAHHRRAPRRPSVPPRRRPRRRRLPPRPIEGNIIEALVKPIGVVRGISDLPWHKDCSIGRHSYRCCGITVGVSVTGADEAVVGCPPWRARTARRSRTSCAPTSTSRSCRSPPRAAISPCTSAARSTTRRRPRERAQGHVHRFRAPAAAGRHRRRR